MKIKHKIPHVSLTLKPIIITAFFLLLVMIVASLFIRSEINKKNKIERARENIFRHADESTYMPDLLIVFDSSKNNIEVQLRMKKSRPQSMRFKQNLDFVFFDVTINDEYSLKIAHQDLKLFFDYNESAQNKFTYYDYCIFNVFSITEFTKANGERFNPSTHKIVNVEVKNYKQTPNDSKYEPFVFEYLQRTKFRFSDKKYDLIQL